MYEQLVSLNNAIYRVLKVFVTALLVAMSFMVFGAVIARFLSITVAWSEELSTYFFSWLTYIGAAVVLRNKGHIGVTAFLNTLKADTRRELVVVGQGIILLFSLVALWLSADMVLVFWESELRSINMDWLKMAYVFLQVPLSSLLFILFIGEQMLATLREGSAHSQGGA